MAEDVVDISTPRLWRRDEWTAKVIKNEDDDGWAVAMTIAGEAEPALVGPWTMGRDKKNPKPLDQSAFSTLVKTAKEVIRRHEQTARARLHRGFAYMNADDVRVRADLDIQPDDDDPHAILGCFNDATGEVIKRGRVAPGFRLNAKNIEGFLAGHSSE